MVVAFENNYYWCQNVITGLITTVSDFFWEPSDGTQIKHNLDGSSGYALPGRLPEWSI